MRRRWPAKLANARRRLTTEPPPVLNHPHRRASEIVSLEWANVQFARSCTTLSRLHLMVHVIVAVFAVFGAVWTLAIWLVGGFTVDLFGITIRANDPFRPLAFAALAIAAYFADTRTLNLRRLVTPLAILIALCPAVAGMARNSWTAGGADQYAYVSQADLWLQGDLTVPVPLAATAPWPEAMWTFHAARISSGRVGTGDRAGYGAGASADDGRRESHRRSLRDVSRHAAQRCAARVDDVRDRPAHRVRHRSDLPRRGSWPRARRCWPCWSRR